MEEEEQGNPRTCVARPAIIMGALLFAAMVVLSACSSDKPKPRVEADEPVQPGGNTGGSGDGGIREGGTKTDGGDAATTCTTLENTGGVIDQLAVADNFPNGTGGRILDGTYFISDAKIYVGIGGQPGVTNNSFQGAITITGTAYERVLLFKNSGGVVIETRVSGTIAPNAVNATLALACPSAVQETVTFTVGTNILTIGNIVTKEVFVFTKKP